ncbi:NACHT domain-containing protein [Vibrio sp. Vb0937]|uniref:NACHT domain-containing protein n=1 Tax=unclassified Vibrio TaxID=2614977 RepID=UPI002965095B|nr:MULTISPECIES: NACHT domain-containing protein [unclassified Vibrio]MDW1825772.1 NACHT domain-containing protein [Vibrio sp. Vb0937]MDW3186981.1 NACHT domain-containing protein [Vibrio sp. Vb0932]
METVAAGAFTKLFVTKIFGEGAKYSASFITKTRKLNDLEKSKQNYLKACERIKRVRTLSYTEKDAAFDEIYVPLNVKSSSNATYLIDSNVNIAYQRVINIVGRAGQGKSTILRKLFLNKLAEGKCLPFFFELKYFKCDTLEQNLINEFKKWGLNFDEETVLEFISNNDVVLFLDAFDEIPTEYLGKVFEQITRINNSCQCELIMTSRPNTSICNAENIDVFRMADLTTDQVEAILDVVCTSRNQATHLKQALNKKEHVLEFIKSPILTVLLQIVFAHSNAIPTSLNDFYNRVYLTLFHRHDELKTNVARGFKTDLTCDESEKVFQAFCYLGLKEGDVAFTKEKALQYMTKALELRGFEGVKAEHYFNDVFHVTNIIQEDGYDNYVFFHRSLQEFYAYKFVAGYFSSDQQKTFFTRCIENIAFRRNFSLVLSFFDDDREATSYLKYYYLPLYGIIVGEDKEYDIEQAAINVIHQMSIRLGCINRTQRLTHHEMNDISEIELVATVSANHLLEEIRNFKSSHGRRVNNAIHHPAFAFGDGQTRNLNDVLEALEGNYKFIDDEDMGDIIFDGSDYINKVMSQSQREHYLRSFKKLIEEEGLISKFKERKARLTRLEDSSKNIVSDDLI